MSSLNTFLSNIKSFAKPNYFLVRIHPFFETNFNINKISLLATSVNIPSTEFGEISFTRAGVKISLPGDIMPGDITITFLVDGDFDLRHFFADWVHRIYNIVECKASHLSDILSSSIDIYQLNDEKKAVSKITINNCYPKSISEINLSYNNQNTIEEFSVVFGYTYYNIGKIED